MLRENTLFISHIPKTAGTSLRKIVQTFNKDVVIAYQGELALGYPNMEFIRNVRENAHPSLVMGHFSFGAHKLLGLPARYATFLRDPIDRVISLYRHQKALPNSSFAGHLQNRMTLGEFVSSQITEQTNNHMCRCIAGVAPEEGCLLQDSWLLDYALHNIDKYYEFVGIVEDFSIEVSRLAKLLGWKHYVIPVENVSIAPPLEVSDETRCIVEYYNNLDIPYMRN